MFNWEFTKYYFMYSWETFWDFFVIIATMILGLYTFGLLVQTMSLARKQSSMVDDMKLKLYMKNPKLHRKRLQEFWQVEKLKRTLSWTELCELIFGEPTLLSIHTYIPTYRNPRSLDIASVEYLSQNIKSNKKVE